MGCLPGNIVYFSMLNSILIYWQNILKCFYKGFYFFFKNGKYLNVIHIHKEIYISQWHCKFVASSAFPKYIIESGIIATRNSCGESESLQGFSQLLLNSLPVFHSFCNEVYDSVDYFVHFQILRGAYDKFPDFVRMGI